MCVKNEEYYLPGFIKHIKKYVDCFVVLDDGSTDNTKAILAKEAKVIKIIDSNKENPDIWDEPVNRKKLLNEAYKLGVKVVLCCDPDERFEKNFLVNLKKLKNNCQEHNLVYGLHFRELYGRYNQYRYDELWNQKTKFILFPLKENMIFDKTYFQRLHISWYYDDLEERKELTKYNLYHLKMIKEQERNKRKELYEKIDPEKKLQKVGYNYLTEMEGIKIKRIPFTKKYDYLSIPSDLKNYKENI